MYYFTIPNSFKLGIPLRYALPIVCNVLWMSFKIGVFQALYQFCVDKTLASGGRNVTATDANVAALSRSPPRPAHVAVAARSCARRNAGARLWRARRHRAAAKYTLAPLFECIGNVTGDQYLCDQ